MHGGRGPYLLMVHGMLSSRRQWMRNIDALAEVVRPVVVELWGHGRSPSPTADRWYGIEACVGQLERLRMKLGADRLLVCGQSFGATLTLRYAVRHPGRVIGQVFTNSVSALSGPERFQVTDERRALIDALESGRKEVLEDLPIHPSRARRLAPEIRAALVAAAGEADPRGIARLLGVTAPQASAASLLPETRCPTLLVNGIREKAFQPFRERVADLIPGCRVVDVDAGHAVNLEAAAAFNAAVIDFAGALCAHDEG
ncbi:MAG: alpha/beta fold hydrolase [Gemmatimonadales bacterium]|nr:alpha/beta fold hydrolase [Gemmatimonadales bacterium]